MTQKSNLMKIREVHSNMYRELLSDISASLYNFDPYEVRDTNDFNTENPEEDLVETFESRYHLSEDNINMYKIMEDYLTYCHNYWDELSTDAEDEQFLDKVCVAYASSYSMPGGPCVDTASISNMRDEHQEMLMMVCDRLDKLSDGDFRKQNSDLLANLDTSGDLRKVFKYSDKLLNAYPDLKEAKSVSKYKDTVREVKHQNKLEATKSSRGCEFDDILAKTEVDCEFGQ